MGKKSKEPKPETPNSSAPASSDNIFKSLFGSNLEEPNNPTSVSIFSDSNPFRSKPTNESKKPQQILQSDVGIAPKNDTQIPNSSDKLSSEKKRKKKSPNNVDSDDPDIDLAVKKSKVEDGVVSESLKNSTFNEKNEKKKKRKKSEVEAEYEERKYGGVDMDIEVDEGVKVKIGEKRKEKDKPEVVPKEGFDDEEKLSRTVFVGNLPLKVKKKALLREFNQFGEIESVRIRSIPLLDDKTPRKGAIMKKKINDAVDRLSKLIEVIEQSFVILSLFDK